MKVLALLSGLWLGGCSVFGIRTTEEPAFTVRQTIGAVEVRTYGERVAAETTVGGDETAARSAGFRRLAAYIFGANHAKAKIAMTAPVAQDSAGSSEKIAMTAPVAQARDADGQWRIRFFMPAGSTTQGLPTPNDPEVRLVYVPQETYGVLRFSGVASPGSVADERSRLLGVLAGSTWKPEGEPVVWFYDPPWTLPPLRRNEVAVTVEPK